jgi:hypothetical protein
MAPIVASTEVARPAEEAFAYVIDLSTMSEWPVSWWPAGWDLCQGAES